MLLPADGYESEHPVSSQVRSIFLYVVHQSKPHLDEISRLATADPRGHPGDESDGYAIERVLYPAPARPDRCRRLSIAAPLSTLGAHDPHRLAHRHRTARQGQGPRRAAGSTRMPGGSRRRLRAFTHHGRGSPYSVCRVASPIPPGGPDTMAIVGPRISGIAASRTRYGAGSTERW